MNIAQPLTYAAAGVDYGPLDRFKRLAQVAARTTDRGYPLKRLGFKVVFESRGESAFLFETIDNRPHRLAHVEEGLGTKNLVADAVAELYSGSDQCIYRWIAQDTIAMIINDMATLGAFPLTVQMHLAVGSSDWFKNEGRSALLAHGWAEACRRARCVWAGGETPTLKGNVEPTGWVIAGSAVGATKLGKHRHQVAANRVRPGDAILFAPSNGIHANGFTLCRALAEQLPHGHGYRYPLGLKQTSYGMALLQPTPLYSIMMEEVLDAGVDVHYAINVTGHGWRKLMRAPQPLTYRVDVVPRPQRIFVVIQEKANLSTREMYSTFNMGVGYALIVPKRHVEKACAAGKRWGLYKAGEVEEGSRQVVIPSLDITYADSELDLR